MKKNLYVQNQIVCSDVLGGPSKFARYNGIESPDPHSAFSIRFEIDSLRSLDEQLTKENPSWSREQVRAERHARYHGGMGQAQIDTYNAEKRGDEIIRSAQAYWDVQDGDLVHPNYGSFQRVIEKAQSAEERASLVSWREAAVSATPGTQIVSLDYHVKGDSGVDVRYADIWEKSADGKIKQQQRIDITKGNNMNGDQSIDFLRQLHRTDRTMVLDQKNNVGFMVIQPGSKIHHDLTQELLNTGKAIKATASHATKHTVSEIQYTAHSLELFLQRKYNKRLADIPLMMADVLTSRTKRMIGSAWDTYISEKYKKYMHGLKTKDVKNGVHGKDSSNNRISKKAELKKVGIALNALVIAKEVHVGVGGIFVHLESLAHLPYCFTKQEKKEKQKLRKNKQQTERRLILTQSEIPTGILMKKEKKKELGPKEQKKLRRREKRLLQKKEKRLISVLRILFEKRFTLNKKMKKEMVLRNQKKSLERKPKLTQLHKEKKRQEKQHILNFSVALTLWMLLGLLEQKKMYGRHKANELGARRTSLNGKNEVIFQTKEVAEGLVQSEPTQWLLFAIIWHLAMIREQGMTQNAGVQSQQIVPKITPKTYKFYSRQFPAAGVIFASAS